MKVFHSLSVSPSVILCVIVSQDAERRDFRSHALWFSRQPSRRRPSETSAPPPSPPCILSPSHRCQDETKNGLVRVSRSAKDAQRSATRPATVIRRSRTRRLGLSRFEVKPHPEIALNQHHPPTPRKQQQQQPGFM